MRGFQRVLFNFYYLLDASLTVMFFGGYDLGMFNENIMVTLDGVFIHY